jgi:hypothetical protein
MSKEKEIIDAEVKEVVETQETTEVATVDAKQKGAEIGHKIKEGFKKAWNSKPAKVAKAGVLIGVGVIGGLCLGKAASKDSSNNGVDDDFYTVDIDKEVPDNDSQE